MMYFKLVGGKDSGDSVKYVTSSSISSMLKMLSECIDPDLKYMSCYIISEEEYMKNTREVRDMFKEDPKPVFGNPICIGSDFKRLKRYYLECQKDCGLNTGDSVRVIRKAKDHEDGWGMVWVDSMDRFIGVVGTIISIDKDGVSVDFYNGHGAWFPYFVLERVESKPLKVSGVVWGRIVECRFSKED
jgi:hypothetical protein